MFFIKKLIIVITTLFLISSSFACSIVTRDFDNGNVWQIASMDWSPQYGYIGDTLLKIIPKNTKENGDIKDNNSNWSTKYTTLTVFNDYKASAKQDFLYYGYATNTQGLSVYLLSLEDTQYPKYNKNNKNLSIFKVPVFIASNFKTTAKAVKFIKDNKINFINPIKGSKEFIAVNNIHFVISDKTGDTDLIEFENGKVKVYKNNHITTNDPKYSTQLKKYKKAMENNSIPVNYSGIQRFQRLTYFYNKQSNYLLKHPAKNIHQQKKYMQDLLYMMLTPELSLKSEIFTYWYIINDKKNNMLTIADRRDMKDIKINYSNLDSLSLNKPITISINNFNKSEKQISKLNLNIKEYRL